MANSSPLDGFLLSANYSPSKFFALPGNAELNGRTFDDPVLYVSLKGALRFDTKFGATEAAPSYAVYLPSSLDVQCVTGNEDALVFTVALNPADTYSFSRTPEKPLRLEDSLSYYLVAANISQSLNPDSNNSVTRRTDEKHHFADSPCCDETDWSHPIIDAITNSVHSSPSLEALGDMVSMHPMALTKKFRKYHGCSIGLYRQRMRAERAFYRVIKQTTPLSEISLSCGYADQSHMTREFQRFFALTPAYLRNAVRPFC